MNPVTLAVILTAVVLVCVGVGFVLLRTSMHHIKYAQTASGSRLGECYAGAGLVVWLLGAAVALQAAYNVGWIN